MDRLPDDALRHVFAYLVDEYVYVAATSRRLRLCAGANHESWQRPRTPLRRVFASSRRLRDALRDDDVARRLRRTCVVTGDVTWSALSKNACFSDGDAEVLSLVAPCWMDHGGYLPFLCRHSRVDLLDAAMAAGKGDVFDSVARVATDADQSRVVESVLLPSAIGGSVRVLRWFQRFADLDKRSERTAWSRIFEGSAHMGRIVCASACASNAYEVLDFVTAEVARQSGRARVSVREEAAAMVCYSVSNGATPSALRWAEQRGSALHDLLANLTPVFCKELAPVRGASAAMFYPASTATYDRLVAGTREGGWMRAAFENMHFGLPLCFFVLARLTPRDSSASRRDVFRPALRDCALHVARTNVPDRILSKVRASMVELARTSPVSACRLLHDLEREGRAMQLSGVRKLRRLVNATTEKGSFLACLLEAATTRGPAQSTPHALRASRWFYSIDREQQATRAAVDSDLSTYARAAANVVATPSSDRQRRKLPASFTKGKRPS